MASNQPLSDRSCRHVHDAASSTIRAFREGLSHTSRVRAEIRADLAALPHLPAGLVDAVELCASEAFANAVEHTRSGQEGGRVVRSLTRPAHNRLRLAVVDDGTTDTTPRIPCERTAAEWVEAETGRGLLLIAALATGNPCTGNKRAGQ